MRRSQTKPAERLRFAVEALPRDTKIAMLDGIQANRIIVGAYVDSRSGGICPMLAAHRNGGRTSLASFARAWDRFTGARRPRLATRREVRALRTYLEMSLVRDGQEDSLTDVAARIRAERGQIAKPAPSAEAPEISEPEGDRIRIRHRADTGERHRAAELRARLRWAWMRPARRYDEFKDLVSAAEEQLSEQRATELLGDRPTAHRR